MRSRKAQTLFGSFRQFTSTKAGHHFCIRNWTILGTKTPQESQRAWIVEMHYRFLLYGTEMGPKLDATHHITGLIGLYKFGKSFLKYVFLKYYAREN